MQFVQTDECRRMEQLLLTLSAAHVFVKFVKCKAGDALKNYPDSQCPTLLIYKGGSVLKQFIKFDSFGGPKATAEGKYPAVPSVISFTPVFSWLSQCGVCAGLVLCSRHFVQRRRCLSGVDGFVLTCLFCLFSPGVFLPPFPVPSLLLLVTRYVPYAGRCGLPFSWMQTLNGSCPSLAWCLQS